MSEKHPTYEEFWEDNKEFYLEEMVLEAAEANVRHEWIFSYKETVQRLVKEQIDYEITDWDWIVDAMWDTGDIEKAVQVLVDLVGELDPPENARNTPTLSAYERNQ